MEKYIHRFIKYQNNIEGDMQFISIKSSGLYTGAIYSPGCRIYLLDNNIIPTIYIYTLSYVHNLVFSRVVVY